MLQKLMKMSSEVAKFSDKHTNSGLPDYTKYPEMQSRDHETNCRKTKGVAC